MTLRHRLVCAVLATATAAASAGCAPVYVRWPYGLTTEPPPQAIREANPPPQHTEEKTSPTKRTATARPHRPAVHKEQEEGDLGMSVVPQEDKSPTPSLSMAGDDLSRDRAQRSLDATSKRLDGVNRARLSGAGAGVYDQANGLVTQARQAMDDKDYVAASGFAEKASMLTDKLTNTFTPTPSPTPH